AADHPGVEEPGGGAPAGTSHPGLERRLLDGRGAVFAGHDPAQPAAGPGRLEPRDPRQRSVDSRPAAGPGGALAAGARRRDPGALLEALHAQGDPQPAGMDEGGAGAARERARRAHQPPRRELPGRGPLRPHLLPQRPDLLRRRDQRSRRAAAGLPPRARGLPVPGPCRKPARPLPAAGGRRTDGLPLHGTAAAGRGDMPGLQLLILDDSATVRQALCGILSGVPGFSVTTAADPLFALAKMARERPDVIVTDLEMPRMDGLAFLRQVMAENPLPVIVCSAATGRGTQTALLALELGAVGIVTKPRLAVRQF